MLSLAITLASLILRLLQVMLFLRAVLSWFPLEQDNLIVRITYEVTEPLILPVRTMLYRMFPAMQNFPIDISFLIIFMLVEGLLSLL